MINKLSKFEFFLVLCPRLKCLFAGDWILSIIIGDELELCFLIMLNLGIIYMSIMMKDYL